jgi:membrane associated rhomboid family serine protease
MRPWYKYTSKTDDYQQGNFITPFSLIWGYGATSTIALIAFSTVVWLVMVVTSGFGWLSLDNWWIKYFALTPNDVIHRLWIHQLLTSVFIHDAPSPTHLLVNMYLLWVFGPRVERGMGSRSFVFFYVATGVMGSLLSLGMRYLTGSQDVASLGASSAVFGVLVAYGFLFTNENLYMFWFYPIRAWKLVVAFVVIEALIMLFGWMPIVDHWAHLGGAAGAAIWMMVLMRLRGTRTEHGWYHSPRRVRIFGPRSRRPTGGFRIIVDNPPGRKGNGHPEGTDDEPPPEWFKL